MEILVIIKNKTCLQHQAGSLYYKGIKMSKILLVDDDIELTDLLAEVLRLTGFEVEVANTLRSIR